MGEEGFDDIWLGVGGTEGPDAIVELAPSDVRRLLWALRGGDR